MLFWFYQEPASEASHVTLHDVPNSAVSEPSTAPPACTSTEDEIASDEPMALSVPPDVPVIASPPDTSMQVFVEDKDVTQSVDTPKPELVFAAASVKPRPEVKSDLSSMFKSLSAKMKMKHQRQSRFSDIVTSADTDSLSSEADPFTAAAGCVPSTVSESSHLPLTSVDTGALSTNEETASGDITSISLPPSSHHVVQSMSLAVSNQSGASAFSLQNYDMQKMTSSDLLLSADHVSSLPAFSQSSPAVTQSNNTIAMTYSDNVTSVISSQLGLCRFLNIK